jgi:Na+/proline symporter
MGLGYLAYGFIGVGKFVEIFVPWEYVSQYVPFHITPEFVPHFYGIILTCFAVFYTLMGGMLSIVWTDLIQYLLMAVSSVVIGIIAMNALADHTLLVPDGWKTPFFGMHLEIDWSSIIPEVNEKIKSDGFSLFSVFFMMMIFKGVLVSLAGPAPNYDMQKILSTKSPREAALMSGSVSKFYLQLFNSLSLLVY